MTNVDRDFLAPPGFDLMYVGDCDADSAEDICRRLADLETRRIDRIVSRQSLLRHPQACRGRVYS